MITVRDFVRTLLYPEAHFAFVFATVQEFKNYCIIHRKELNNVENNFTHTDFGLLVHEKEWVNQIIDDNPDEFCWFHGYIVLITKNIDRLADLEIKYISALQDFVLVYIYGSKNNFRGNEAFE